MAKKKKEVKHFTISVNGVILWSGDNEKLYKKKVKLLSKIYDEDRLETNMTISFKDEED